VKRNRKLIFFIFWLWTQSTFDLEFLCGMRHTRSTTVDAIGRRAFGNMKAFFRNDDSRAGLSALVMIVTLLAIGALAKLDAAVPFFHLAR
jgi:hypothetical protein